MFALHLGLVAPNSYGRGPSGSLHPAALCSVGGCNIFRVLFDLCTAIHHILLATYISDMHAPICILDTKIRCH